MPLEPTRYSRISVGHATSTQSVADKFHGDTGENFSVIGGASFYKSTVSISGAVTMQSTLSVRGAVTASGGLSVGGGSVAVVSTGTTDLSFGAVAPLESSSVKTFACSGLSRGDFVAITPDSLYPVTAANRDVSYFCSSSSTVGEAHAWAVNSTLTSVTPTAATFFRWVRIKGGDYPAA